MRDVTDGSLYRQQRKDLDLDDMDLTITINADGSPVFNSSKFWIWPFQVQLSILSLAHLHLTGQKKEHYKTSKKHTGLEFMFEV
ncbi:hypothetical protein MTO96_032432 [Rhipicephalus appendiculatus]